VGAGAPRLMTAGQPRRSRLILHPFAAASRAASWRAHPLTGAESGATKGNIACRRRIEGTFAAKPSPTIFLNADLNPQDASEIIAHEIGHYRHFLDRESWNRSSREEKEHRADEFARDVMAVAPIRSWYASMGSKEPVNPLVR
jgi:IrrE N-terminal-like domain